MLASDLSIGYCCLCWNFLPFFMDHYNHEKVLHSMKTKYLDWSWILHVDVIGERWNLGLQSTRLHHRLSETRSIAANLYSEPVDVNVAVTALTLLPKRSGLALQDNSGLPGVKVGTAYVADDGRVVNPETGNVSLYFACRRKACVCMCLNFFVFCFFFSNYFER